MNWRFLSMVLGYIMLLLVFSGTLTFAFTNVMEDRLYGTKRLFFVIMLFAYGVYRAFRLYQLHKQIKNEL